MPSGVAPELAADRGVGNEEADGVGQLFRPDQTTKLNVRQNVLLDVAFRHALKDGSIDKARVDDGGTHAMEHRLLHQGLGGAFQGRLGGRVGDLPLVTLGGNGADEDDGALNRLVRVPLLLAVYLAVMGHAGNQLQCPVHRMYQVDLQYLME